MSLGDESVRKPEEVAEPHEGEEQRPLAREDLGEGLAAGAHGDGRRAVDAVVEGDVGVGEEGR